MPEPFLELRGITRTYPGVTALDDVSFAVAPGEVIGLIGENGAGKSTLMKIMGGVVAPSRGQVVVDGHAREALTVADAIRAGIAFVHQELNLFDNLDVAANVYIGREPLKGGWLRLVDERSLHRRIEPFLTRLGCTFKADTPVADLSLAERQLVEIVKALSLDARLVIMDEPTSSLTIAETERLLRVIADLKAQGVSVIFISHRLAEVERCADRVIVLRDGRVVGALSGDEIRHDRMTRLMIGRDLKSLYTPPASPPGAVALSIDGLRTTAHPAKTVTLDLRRGEILGLAGLVGSGRTELACAVFGIDTPIEGRIRLDGAPLSVTSPSDAIAAGIYLVPEDRKRSGLLLDVSITRNVTLADLPAHANLALVDTGSEAKAAEAQKARLGIRAPDVETAAGTLSGGNQQKVVLGRWLSMRPRVIILDEPTRGIDVGAKGEIYALMRQLADQGVAILMISSDMEEVIGVSDRVAVMHEGAIGGFLDRAQLSEHSILHLAVGNSVN